ncbi:MAG: hypothetical protein K2X47_00180 [Bdellovibrionales bacterium]|nr:hypothetical protein [Bdellovibrionales bacterium]
MLTIFICQTSAALENLVESNENPAVVEAKVSRPCSAVQERMEKLFPSSFAHVPFVKSVSLNGQTEWVKKTEDASAVNSEHSTYHLMRTTSPADFPMSVISTVWTKSECKPTAKSCVYAATATTEGKNALLYETRVTFGPTGNYTSSFTSNITLAGLDNNVNCQVRMSLQVLDNHYLWLKRHLVRKDVDPVTIQKTILKGHNQWAKKIIPELEANQ